MKENVGFASRAPRLHQQPRPADALPRPAPSSLTAIFLSGQDRNPAFPLARPARSTRGHTPPTGTASESRPSSCGDPQQAGRAGAVTSQRGRRSGDAGCCWPGTELVADTEGGRAGLRPAQSPPHRGPRGPRAPARARTEVAFPVCLLLRPQQARRSPPRGPAQSTLPASRRGGGGGHVARMSLPGPGLHSCFWKQTLQDPDSEAGVPPHSLRGRTKRRVWDRRYQGRDPCGHERGGSARAELTPLPRAPTPPACPPTGPGAPVKGCSPAPRVRPQSAPRRSFRFRGK